MTWAFSQKVGGNDKLVLLALADHADENWSCFPGMETIAAKASVSVRTVQRVLERLESIGLVAHERRNSSTTGYRTSSRYTLLTDSLAVWPNGQKDGPNGQLCQLESEPSVEPSVKERATRLPASWSPTKEHVERAMAEGLDLDRQVEIFRAHAEEHARKAVSWNGAFTRWLINAAEFRSRGNTQRPGPRTDSQRVLDIMSLDSSDTTLEQELLRRMNGES